MNKERSTRLLAWWTLALRVGRKSVPAYDPDTAKLPVIISRDKAVQLEAFSLGAVPGFS